MMDDRECIYPPHGMWAALRRAQHRSGAIDGIALYLLSPRSELGATDDHPERGFICEWPSLGELMKEGRVATPLSVKKALRRLEAIGYVHPSFRRLDGEPIALIALHAFLGQPATHTVTARGTRAEEAWWVFRGGKFLDEPPPER